MRIPTLCVFSIDVEPDNQWENFHSVEVRNIDYIATLHRVFAEAGAVPTYLLTYSVATCSRSIELIKRVQEWHRAEIGAHLHPWDNPPFRADRRDADFQAFPHDLACNEYAAKMERLTAALMGNFGRPVSYRAGRFGFTAEHIAVLERLGYRADTSIVPLFDRRGKWGIPRLLGGKGGQDYREAPLVPYHPSYEDHRRAGAARLLEIPVTTGFTRLVHGWIRSVYLYGPLLARRVMHRSGVTRLVAAQPTQYTEADILALCDHAVAAGTPVLNFTFHSSEVMPRGSPRFATNEEVAEFLQKLGRILAHLRALRVEFVTLAEAAARLSPLESGRPSS